MELFYDPAIPLLGICPKKHKTLIPKNTRMPMFIAELFAIAKARKQCKCPSIDEWIKNAVVHTCNGIFLGHKKE